MLDGRGNLVEYMLASIAKYKMLASIAKYKKFCIAT